jgi:hypothetical protein
MGAAIQNTQDEKVWLAFGPLVQVLTHAQYGFIDRHTNKRIAGRKRVRRRRATAYVFISVFSLTSDYAPGPVGSQTLEQKHRGVFLSGRPLTMPI